MTTPPPPKSIEVIARGLLRHAGRVLLCRNVEHGYLYLPGGHVEPGESAGEALAREFAEETGLEVRAGRSLLVCEVLFEQGGRRRHEINLVFHVEPPRFEGVEPPSVQSREGGIAFEWAEQAALVEMDIRPPVLKAWLVTGCDLGDTTPTGWLSVRE